VSNLPPLIGWTHCPLINARVSYLLIFDLLIERFETGKNIKIFSFSEIELDQTTLSGLEVMAQRGSYSW
jgi:hypothetical protein